MPNERTVGKVLIDIMGKCMEYPKVPITSWTDTDTEALANDIMELASELKWLAYASRRQHNS